MMRIIEVRSASSHATLGMSSNRRTSCEYGDGRLCRRLTELRYCRIHDGKVRDPLHRQSVDFTPKAPNHDAEPNRPSRSEPGPKQRVERVVRSDREAIEPSVSVAHDL